MDEAPQHSYAPVHGDIRPQAQGSASNPDREQQQDAQAFAVDLTDEEAEIMGRHAAYWQPRIDSGQMVVFGPVDDDTGSWGLGVLEVEDEDDLRAFAARDPAVTSGNADLEIGTMLAGFVRPR